MHICLHSSRSSASDILLVDSRWETEPPLHNSVCAST